MKKRRLDSIVRYCDRTLKTEQFTDWPGAMNGLQVENSGGVTKIAAAVATVAHDTGLAGTARPLDIEADVTSRMFTPAYREYV